MDKYHQEVTKAIQYLEFVKFDKRNPWHRTLISLYCAIIEYSDSLLHLIDNNKPIAIPAIFRSLLEAYVDFKNLAQDSNYLNQMEASYHSQWIKLFREASNGENPYLSGLNEQVNLKEQMERTEKALSRLKKSGHSPLTALCKFEKAGMAEEYKSIYNDLCSDSHNNIRSLVDRFMVIDLKNFDFQMTLFKKENMEDFEKYVVTGTHYLRDVSHNIHIVLETGYQDEFSI